MPTNFYKTGGSYYTADTGRKILDLNQLQTLASAGGKEIAPPTAQSGSVPIPNPAVIPNYNVTNRIGETLYGTPKRDGTDILVPTSQPGQSNLDQWKSGANLVEAARSIIQMKQGYNKDIQAAKQVWGEKARDISAWEGEQKIFAGMSPADQAQIRAKQYAVAETHLAGLADEEKYRASRTEDTLKYISDIYSEKVQELENQKKDANEKERIKIDKRQLVMQEERNRILNARDKIEMGVDLDATDLYGSNISSDFSRIGFKEGGSLSWRSNNPGNIKFGDFARKYGAVQGAKATDGGYFAIFPDEEIGQQAMMELLKSPNYQKLSVDAAMKRWSNNGYGAEIYKGGISIPMAKLNDIQLQELTQAMIQREGYKIGKSLQQTSTKGLDYLSSLTGTSIKELEGLNLSAEELKLFTSIAEADKKKISSQEMETSQHVKLFDEADKMIQNEDKKGTDPNLIYGMLVRQYSPSLTTEEIKTIMTQNDHEWDPFLSKWR